MRQSALPFSHWTSLLVAGVLSVSSVSLANENQNKELVLSSHDFSQSCYKALLKQDGKLSLPKDSDLEEHFYAISSQANESNEEKIRSGLIEVLSRRMQERNIDSGVVASVVGAEMFADYQSIFELYVKAQLEATGFRSKDQLLKFYRSFLYLANEENRRQFADSVILRMAMTFPLEISLESPKDLETAQKYMETFQVTDIAFGKFVYFWKMMLDQGHLDILRGYVRVLIRAVATSYVSTQTSSSSKKLWGHLTSMIRAKGAQQLPEFLFYEDLLGDQSLRVFNFQNQIFSKNQQESRAWRAFVQTEGSSPVLQHLFIEQYFPYMKYLELRAILERGALPQRLKVKIAEYVEALEGYKSEASGLKETQNLLDEAKYEKREELRLHRTKLPEIGNEYDRLIEQQVRTATAKNTQVGTVIREIIADMRKIFGDGEDGSYSAKHLLIAGSYISVEDHRGASDTPALKKEVLSLIREAKRLGITKHQLLNAWEGIFKIQVPSKIKGWKGEYHAHVVGIGDALNELPQFQSSLDKKINSLEETVSAQEASLHAREQTIQQKVLER